MLAILVAVQVTVVPIGNDLSSELRTAVEQGLSAAGCTASHAPAVKQGCNDACLAQTARGKVLGVRVRNAEGAVMVELRIVDPDGPARSAQASGIGDRAAAGEVPGAIARLFDVAAAVATPRIAAPRQVPPQVVKKPERPSDPDDEPGEKEVVARRRRIASEQEARDEKQAKAHIQQLVEEVTASVEKVRGLKRTRKVDTQILDDESFKKAYRRNSRSSKAEIAATSARWVAFGMARALANPEEIEVDVLDEAVLGFYDPKERKLYVRASGTGVEVLGEEKHIRSVLAHEIEHALQDQTWGLSIDKGDRDSRLAYRAMVEGDAKLTEAAYDALDTRTTTGWIVARHTAALRSADLIQLAEKNGYSSQLSTAPRIVQEEAIFPYVWGFGLASDLYRRGGFAAIDNMFRHPPRSTGQVLDAEAYFSGRGEAVVPEPKGLPGTVGDHGRLGVLGTKAALAACIDPQLSLDTARQLRGDGYTVVRMQKSAVAAAWATAWSDAEAATTFKNLLEMSRSCWKEQALQADSGELFVSEDGYIASEENRVVLVRGLPESQAKAIAAKALRFNAKVPAASPPFPIQGGALLADATDMLVGDQFTSVRLGLHATLPATAEPYRFFVADLAVRSRKRGFFGSITFVPEAPTEQSLSALINDYIGEAADWPGGRLEMEQKAVTISGRNAREHRWTNPTSPFELSIVVLPACSGRAWFAIQYDISGSNQSRDAAREWISHIEAKDENPPACSDLTR
jgi:hypothetical protein